MDQRLMTKLTSSGVLTRDWTMTFLAVPRREFLPDVLWELHDEDDMYHPVYRHEQPSRWQELANGDTQVVTQVDDGRPACHDGLGDVPTSSASMPYMVALMLKHLAANVGERVLEIGTGTGWNAALMAQRIGADRITTVEIDDEVAEDARRALSAAGFGQVNVVTGNGSEGYPGEAPYHRVIATAACHTVPFAWVEQCRPGARIVAPWASEFKNWGLIALDVHADQSATGGVVGTADFMRLRDQRLGPWVIPERWQEEIATTRTTSLAPAEVMTRGDVLMAMSAWVPNCQARYRPPSKDPDGKSALFLADHRTGSWARLYAEPADSGPFRVVQGGERWLFDEVEAAYELWLRKDRPGTDEWLITVDKDGQRIELR